MANYNGTGKFILNKESMDELVLDLYNQIDSITSILNKIKYKIYDINDYFTGDVANAYQQRLSKYIAQMATIKSNLNAYASDMMIVKDYVVNADLRNAQKILQKTEDIEERVKSKDSHEIKTEFDTGIFFQ